MSDPVIGRIIDKYFTDNPDSFVAHHLDSYNDFFEDGLKRIFREKNPIRIMKMQDTASHQFRRRCNLYLGGRDGSRIYYGKPVIYDDERDHFMYPNEARLRNMTYGITVHYDVEVEFFIAPDEGEIPEGVARQEEPTYTTVLERVFLGRFPIMLMSDLCILRGLTPRVRFELGECRNDYGGYFIIDGKEKCVISQEKFADNMVYIRDKGNELYSHSAAVRSVSEDASKPVRTMRLSIVAPTPSLTNNQVVAIVPNVRKPIPLFILMRALGIESDEEIIRYCLLDMERYSTYIDLFIPSVHDAGKIFNQEMALKYIATFTKGKTVPHALEILTNYLLPHVGEMNFQDKAFFLGHMTKELLRVFTKEMKPTDRDSFAFKRVELPGTLLYDLFNEYYSLQQRNIYQKIDKEYYYKQGIYQNNFTSLIEANYREFFSERLVEKGFRKAFKGDWGSEPHTKRAGIVQDLNRLSYNSALSQLRKINLPLEASAKVIGPRLLHSSQWGIIDPVDTPDGGNVGLHKHMSIAAKITRGCSGRPLIEWLREIVGMKLLSETTIDTIANSTKILVNGAWVGTIRRPVEAVALMRKYRRSALLPVYTSVRWNIAAGEIQMCTDSGRLCRPIFYIDQGIPSYQNQAIIDKIESNSFTWDQLVAGFATKKDPNFSVESCRLYDAPQELYGIKSLEALEASRATIEYIDTAEEEGALVATDSSDLSRKPYTHIEIHPSLILGVMGNQVVFPENNQLPRDLFACGQMRQAVSLYHSNFQTRIDKMGVVLNYGQTPLVKSRYLEKINKEQHPYGENVVVAIACYGGYNVEDSILFNEGSLKRGLFRTTYYNSYEAREDSSKVGNSQVDSHFANIEDENVTGLKPGFDYSHLDKYGMIKEGTLLDDKKVLIGKVMTNLARPDTSVDASVFPKKGQLGYVDKTFITEGELGFRLAKIRVRDERVPAIGDKFCSRCGQKGTIGLVIPEADMPYGDDGIRPDIIVNPHALPSRMTIGQLVETLMGKTCALYGGFGDCTAFMNKGEKSTFFGKMLTQQGYHSSGNQILYNGQSGEQMDAQIFIGPTYYMRLKHMVKDKINYRARGPRTVLTRQTVQGRANDGGLRIGEMERDGVIAHGAAKFLQESMLVRGDEYYMAVCNKTGMTAVYNTSYNLFLSPYADGPLRFTGTLDDGMNIENISRFGRSFSVIRIPYALKLLIQELQTMNVQLRLITEDNIDQLSSMSFSGNIGNLLGNDAGVKEAIEITREEEAAAKPEPEIQKLLKATPGAQPKSKAKPAKPAGPDYRAEPPPAMYAAPPPARETQPVVVSPDVMQDPASLGWYRVAGDMDGDEWASVIVGPTGETTSKWYTEDYDGDPPDAYPPGWVPGDLYYPDGANMPPLIVIAGLRQDQGPNNWERVIKQLKEAGPTAAQDIELPPVARPAPRPPPPRTVPPAPPRVPAIVIQPSPSGTLVQIPPDSPQYVPTSPAYARDSASASPQYVPTSPAYAPDSPSYAAQDADGVKRDKPLGLREVDPAEEVKDIIEVVDTSQNADTSALATAKTSGGATLYNVNGGAGSTEKAAPTLTTIPPPATESAGGGADSIKTINT